ncbi:MAG: acyltransferase [Cyclobacteriaceae bacterium]
MDPKKIQKTYFENLDGLRFICFLSVFFFHSFYTESEFLKSLPIYIFVKYTLFGNGNLGVNFFFVLSGFLITYLLIIEKSKNDRIGIRNFWLRRALRIWPVFYVCVFFGFVIFPVLKQLFDQAPLETARPVFYLFFINNFDLIKNGLPDSSILGVLWSVAVEEQFYFVWPVLLSILLIRWYPLAFIGIVITSIVFRILYNDPIFLEHHTLSCMGDMAIGALGAWAVQDEKFKIFFINLNRKLITVLYLAAILFFFYRKEVVQLHLIVLALERILIAIVFLMIILEQNYSTRSFFKLGKFKFISQLGVISYGLYCYQFIGILVATNTTKILFVNDSIWSVLILETTLALLITVGIAFFSYKYFETPFLKYKEKFSLL